MKRLNNVQGNTRLTGVILAGGAGRRLGGRDKGLLHWRGQPLVAQVAARLRPQVGELWINCNRNRDDYIRYADRVFSDLTEAFGPLAGLRSLPDISSSLLLVTPCDTPLLPLDLGERLLRALEASPEADIAYASAAGDAHYLHAVLRRRVLAGLPDYLGSGGRSVQGWYASQHTVTVEFSGADFLNCNTPEAFD
ncbi:MAG: molybdenum cofactor guanylyltransferase [Haliea sp.]|uniref:molybdenum cofactor guanylyltransferase MobA n=1 Tax=Haliea sp. TaxID=1932666 RepID=UPI000C486684|nr:molybdenum cofactor guanylyltransferase MobA [Haliea sp.]MBM70073.1 molybdenum cofactor guanylyltransferase [Haliea sp.]